LLQVDAAELDEVWKLDFPEESGEPVLYVNKSLVANHHALVRSEQFVSLVLPEVLRAILTRILIADKFGDTSDDSDDWRSLWLRFSATLPGVADPPRQALAHDDKSENTDELESWIDAAVGAFARRAKIDRHFSWWTEADEQ
jgi:hypothetical protein